MVQVKKGDTVRQILPAPIEGTVVGFNADQETGALQVCVEYQADGETRQRYFDSNQIDLVASA
jgi:hypothetical protein